MSRRYQQEVVVSVEIVGGDAEDFGHERLLPGCCQRPPRFLQTVDGETVQVSRYQWLDATVAPHQLHVALGSPSCNRCAIATVEETRKPKRVNFNRATFMRFVRQFWIRIKKLYSFFLKFFGEFHLFLDYSGLTSRYSLYYWPHNYWKWFARWNWWPSLCKWVEGGLL